MKFRNTVQLGAALILLVLLYFGFQLLERESEEMAQEAKRIFTFEAAEVQELSIGQLDAPPTAGQREADGGWAITAPNPAIRAYNPLWDRVAEHLAGLKNERSLPKDSEALASYGLTVPQLTVVAKVAGKDRTLRVGYLEPTQSYRYAQVDDGEVFLVNKDEVYELDRSLDLLRHGFVLDDPASPIVWLEYTRLMTEELAKGMKNPPAPGEPSETLTVEREGAEGLWRQVSPVDVPANQDAVNDLVAEIQNARGRGFIDNPESLADYGLEPGLVRLTVVDSGEGRTQVFYFGEATDQGAGGGIYVRKEGEPGVFLMDPQIIQLFPALPTSFRERRLFTRVKNLTRLERVSEDKGYTLELDPAKGWTLVNPPVDDTDQFYVQQFINALKTLEGTRFYPGAPAEYGLDAPEMQFRLTVGEVPEPLDIRLVKATDVPGHYYALTDGGEVASLPEEHIEFLKGGPQAFRDRSLMRFDLTRVVKIELDYEGQHFVLEKEHERWLVTEPAQHFMPNQSDASDLLKAVDTLRSVGAEDYDPNAAAEYGLDDPRFSIQLSLAPVEGDGPVEVLGPLTVGAVVPGMDQQRFARSVGRDGVFRIPQRFIETVQAALGGIHAQRGGESN